MKIHTYPDPILKTKSELIQTIDEETLKLIDQMTETMYAAPGIGLAANQVGVLKQLIVYDVDRKEKGPNPLVLINPEIVLAEGNVAFDEACLSVLDYTAEVDRHAQIKVKGFDRQGKPVDIEAEDLLAVCLQHEIDHLNGILFIDHISSLKRSLYNKRLKKMLKKEEESSGQ
jgi:peptide deformylase